MHFFIILFYVWKIIYSSVGESTLENQKYFWYFQKNINHGCFSLISSFHVFFLFLKNSISIIFVWEKYAGYDYACIPKMQESAVHLHLFIVTGLYQAMHLLVLLFEPSFTVNEIELLFHDFLWRLLRDTYYIFSDNHHNWDHKTFSSNWKKMPGEKVN